MALGRRPSAAVVLVVSACLLSACSNTSAPKVRLGTREAEFPLSFEANRGQTDRRVRYVARGPGYALFLTDRESVLALSRGGERRPAVLTTRLLGATARRPQAERRLPGVVNIFRGPRSAWRTGIPTFGRVRYRSVYPGIDAVYHGNRGRLEYDFVVARHADPARIRLGVEGSLSLSLSPVGDLLLKLPGSTLRELRPHAYQRIGRRRIAVAAGFVIRHDRVGFRVGRYDRTRTLVIDPQVAYSTYLGGSKSDRGRAIAVDGSGDAYVAGETLSTNFPRLAGRSANYQGDNDVFVTKFNPHGSGLVYSDLIGGTGNDEGLAIALDPSGDAYVAGDTWGGTGGTTDYPVTNGALQTSNAGSGGCCVSTDAFVTELNADGTSLVYSTYLGGTGTDVAGGIAVDADGNAYVDGTTNSATFPGVTVSSLQSSLKGSTDAFVTKIDAGGSTTGFSTYLGGTGTEDGNAIALDASGNVYVGGDTSSTDFPGVTLNSAQKTHGGSTTNGDAFVAKLASSGSSIDWATYLGGTSTDSAIGIAVDGSGEPYITGGTNSSDFPLTTNALYTLGGGVDAFVSKLKADGTAFLYTTYLGGKNNPDGSPLSGAAGTDEGLGIAVDGSGSAYVTGVTASNPFLQQSDGCLQTPNCAYVAKLSFDGATVRLSYVEILGGTGNDQGNGIAVDASGDAYVAGTTSSDPFVPITDGAYQTLYGGDSSTGTVYGDAFAAEIASTPAVIGSGPSGITGTATPSFTFSSATGADTFECHFDNEAASTCTSPASKTLTDGPHTFTVQAYDAGSATDGPPATRAFTVDSDSPAPFDLSSPGEGATVGTQPTFSWTASHDTTAIAYKLMVDGQKLQDVASSACSGGTCTAQAASVLAGGQHAWNVVATDGGGHSTTSTSTRHITVSDPPNAQLTIAPNPALVGKTVTFDAAASADATHTITKYEWDLDGDGSFETDTGATPTTTHAYSKAGTYDIGLRVTDSAGQVATTTVSLTITSLTSSSGEPVGVSIDKSAQYTNDPKVTLSIVAPTTTTSILVSNDGGFMAAKTFLPTGAPASAAAAGPVEIPWTLDSAGPERLPKTVYVRFLVGTFSSPNYTDDIILDTRPPVVQQASVGSAGAASAGSAAQAARIRTWKVRVRAKDDNSGVGKVQVTTNKRKPGRLITYKTGSKVQTFKVKSAGRPKFARARDRAGNFSPWKKIK